MMNKTAEAAPNEQAILAAFQTLIDERNALANATLERQQDVDEHELVLKTLEPMERGRRCYRLVGDVLVERTVADVLPAVQTNRDNLVEASVYVCGWVWERNMHS